MSLSLAKGWCLIGAALVVTAGSGLPAFSSPCTPPAWSKSTTVKRNGSRLIVLCDGEGATADLAETEARDKCDARAALEYRSTVNVKELTVSTDHDAASHREVTDETCVLGLVCNRPKSYSCEQDGETHAWRRCLYDLSQVHEGTCAATNGTNNDPGHIAQKVAVKDAGSFSSATNTYVISISATPPCDDLVINGKVGRRIKCKHNPMRLTVKPGDREIIVRAKGYLPKTLDLRNLSEDPVDVYLDTAD